MTEKRQTTAIKEKVHQEIHQSAVSNRCQRGNHVMDGTEPESTLKTSNSSVGSARPLKSGPCSLSHLQQHPGEASRGRDRAVQSDRWVHNQPPSPQLMKTSHTPPSGTSEKGRSSRGKLSRLDQHNPWTRERHKAVISGDTMNTLKTRWRHKQTPPLHAIHQDSKMKLVFVLQHKQTWNTVELNHLT